MSVALLVRDGNPSRPLTFLLPVMVPTAAVSFEYARRKAWYLAVAMSPLLLEGLLSIPSRLGDLTFFIERGTVLKLFSAFNLAVALFVLALAASEVRRRPSVRIEANR